MLRLFNASDDSASLQYLKGAAEGLFSKSDEELAEPPDLGPLGTYLLSR